MRRSEDQEQAEPRLTPEGVFVVQLRSDSDLAQRRLRGRVEHVTSGRSVQFASIDDLLGFMSRYATGATEPSTTGAEDKKGGSR